jgi:hypothetical protein
MEKRLSLIVFILYVFSNLALGQIDILKSHIGVDDNNFKAALENISEVIIKSEKAITQSTEKITSDDLIAVLREYESKCEEEGLYKIVVDEDVIISKSEGQEKIIKLIEQYIQIISFGEREYTPDEQYSILKEKLKYQFVPREDFKQYSRFENLLHKTWILKYFTLRPHLFDKLIANDINESSKHVKEETFEIFYFLANPIIINEYQKTFQSILKNEKDLVLVDNELLIKWILFSENKEADKLLLKYTEEGKYLNSISKYIWISRVSELENLDNSIKYVLQNLIRNCNN